MDARTLSNMKMSVAGIVYKLGLTAKIGCLLCSMFFLLSLLFNSLKPLAVTPGYLIPPNFWIWTLATHPFIETNTILLLCGMITLVLNATILEESMSSIKLVMYYGIVCSLSALLTALFYLFLYMITFNIEYLFDVRIYGAGGLIGGSVVAIKQSLGDQVLVGSIGLQVKDTALLILGALMVGAATSFIRGSYLWSYVFGVAVGWIYLRFYQNHSRGRGDQSEKFAFKYFFPKPVQGPVGVASDIVYNLLLKMKICRKTVYRYDVGAPSSITLTLSGVNALDAERRRNKAIKALDERLKKSTQDTTAWPSISDDGKSPEEEKTPVLTEAEVKNDKETSSLDGSASPDIVTIDMDNSSPNENNG